jgi:hypothetical protein
MEAEKADDGVGTEKKKMDAEVAKNTAVGETDTVKEERSEESSLGHVYSHMDKKSSL